MERNEVNKLFKLLKAFYPHATGVDSEEIRLAWYMALEKYTYEEVKASALRYAVKGRYFPQLSELMESLPTETKSHAWMERYIKSDGTSGQVSRYAREHKISWHAAEEEMRCLGLRMN